MPLSVPLVENALQIFGSCSSKTSSIKRDLSAASFTLKRVSFSRSNNTSGVFRVRFPLKIKIARKNKFKFLASVSKNEPPFGEGDKEGDIDTQDILVQMVRLQTGKVRVNSFVEERSQHLTSIVEEADSEFTRIAKQAEESMAETGKKILDDVDEKARAFEEELAKSRAELEERERKMDEFEDHIANVRSEGLFFKSLYKPKKSWNDKTVEEKEAILKQAKALASDAKKAAFGSESRKRIYQILAFILSVGVFEGLMAEEISWLKVGVYSALLFSVTLQLMFEDNYQNDADD